MSELKTGEIGWCDLTVTHADDIRAFYSEVIGWQTNPVNMGDYDDYSMQIKETGEDVTGICHAKGVNADLPAQWLLYFVVDDLDRSIAKVTDGGGEILTEIKHFGESKYVVIKDPAGAVCALYQQ